MTEKDAKERVVKAGRRLVESGLIARTWGNVSCRISESHFAVTPSGRDYLSLTAEDIVTVAISDCSYGGNIKPSSEKGVHADVYKHNPDINFVIHTHQDNASVISALGLDSIKPGLNYPLLGDEIICASYGLPGTKKLRRGVSDALKRSKGNAIIMKHHGAVCFGKDDEEAFKVASDLEHACDSFVAGQYRKITQMKDFDPDQMRQFALSRMTRASKISGYEMPRPYCDSERYDSQRYDSERTQNGFKLYIKNGEVINVEFGQLGDHLPKEAEIHNEIYLKNGNINYIIHADTPNILTVSRANITLYPLVDDFAQIAGTRVKTVLKDPSKIAAALKSASAVFMGNNGAFCCGASEGDASAVNIIVEKNCKALTTGTLFGKIKPISWLDSKLMRFVYLKKYSKRINLV